MIDLAVYAGLFLAAFTAATLLPAQSEILVVGLLLTDHPPWLVLTVASVGNVLGSRLIEFQSQNMTVAARAIAEKKVSGQRSYRVATRRQSFRRPNMISMRLRRL